MKDNNEIIHSSAFAQPMFRRYFPSTCFISLAVWMVRFLIGWMAWELTHSAFWVGIVAATMLLPTFLLSPIFAILTDRINPRNGLIFTVLSQGGISFLAGIAHYLDMLNLPLLMAQAVLLGIVTSAHQPVRLALVPRLVPRGALPSAIGYGAMLFNTSRIIGPAIAAWIIAVFSESVAFFVASSLCVFSIPFLLSIKGILPLQKERNSRFVDELKAGFVYAAAHPVIRLILCFTLINGILGRTIMELLPAFSGQLLLGNAETLAILSGIAGVGSIAGGLLLTRQSGDQQRLIKLVSYSLIFAAMSLFFIQFLNGLYLFGVLIFILSLVTTIAGTGAQALAQLTVDDTYRSRVLSFWTMMAMGVPAVSAIGVGALAQAFGFPVVSAIIAVVAFILLGTLRFIISNSTVKI
jgi:MFS family permease